jgi:lipopolysaccharide/colanic/teichoic acid biosynthesis glycosyltransferase
VYKKHNNTWHEYADFILLELLCLNISFVVAYCIRHGWSELPYARYDYLKLILLTTLFDLLISIFFNSFGEVLKKGYYKEFMSSLKHVLMVFAAVTLYLFALQESAVYSRISLFLMFGFDCGLGYAMRMIYKHTRQARTTHQRSVLIIAKKPELGDILAGFDKDNDNGVFICGYVDPVNSVNMGEIEERNLIGNIIANQESHVNNTDRNVIDPGSKGIRIGNTGLKDKGLKKTESEDTELQNSETGAQKNRSRKKKRSHAELLANPITSMDTAVEYVCREWVDEVFIKLPEAVDDTVKEKIAIITRKFVEMGVTVHTTMNGFGSTEGRQVVETVAGMTVVTSSIRTATAGQLLLKRFLDVVGGLIGCIFTIIIGIIIAPFILLRSPGNLFFRQTRVGMNGKKFKMLKFRSMVKNADAKKAELLAQNTVSDNMMFKLDWDPRIIGNRITKDGKKKTGIGEFIRRTSIDEFPQFFNVLIGDMSLVGTRPPTVDEWEKYDLHHRARLAVRPGITGMWQVSGRSDIKDFEEVVRLDTEYIYNWSIGMDLRILVKTIGAVLKGKGAR